MRFILLCICALVVSACGDDCDDIGEPITGKYSVIERIEYSSATTNSNSLAFTALAKNQVVDLNAETNTLEVSYEISGETRTEIWRYEEP